MLVPVVAAARALSPVIAPVAPVPAFVPGAGMFGEFDIAAVAPGLLAESVVVLSDLAIVR